MSIRVESTSIVQGAGPVEPAAAAKSVETPSALAAAAEQTESTASDTEETEAEESDEESEADASVEDAEAKDSEDGKPNPSKKKSGSQRRKERAERAEAEVARLQRLVEDMALKRAGESKTESKVESKPVTADGEPDPDNFETHREYVKALTRWEAKQLQEEERRKSQKQTLEAEQAKALSTFQERRQAFAEKTKDFEATLESLSDIPRTPVFEAVILESELGPEILYELAKNPEEAKRIAKLPPIAAALELGKIAAKVATDPSEEKKPEPKKITKALKPIEPVGSRGGHVEKSLHEVAANGSQAEYERLRAKQRSA